MTTVAVDVSIFDTPCRKNVCRYDNNTERICVYSDSIR